MRVDIAEISWQQTMALRHQVLWPDKPLVFCRVAEDEDGCHLGAFADDKLVCVASLFVKDNAMRLRKFATLPEYQGQGIGSSVLSEAILRARNLGLASFWCDARQSASGLYRRFGLCQSGEPFYKGEIAYARMALTLSP
ncbi:GNAT family N-acetyltransferase [Bowmanella sp. Y26]|uniref:GNAT family N-acetyltransferase n=1 Tax=Bowmanella yangjiangensis TaxID=2811230 RepID=UPI001BDBF497|nr:GNAT family N-acetyltransferase [Bowmanella yangjiangensis]MBT1065104.1 GNAT family N-acetyltransferase [Bowmanella yangjiangensis]